MLLLALTCASAASAQVSYRLDAPARIYEDHFPPVLTLTVTNGSRTAVPLPVARVPGQFACPAFKVFRKATGQQVAPHTASSGCHEEDALRPLWVQPGQTRQLRVALPLHLGAGEYWVQLRIPPPGGQAAQYVTADLRVLRRPPFPCPTRC